MVNLTKVAVSLDKPLGYRLDAAVRAYEAAVQAGQIERAQMYANHRNGVFESATNDEFWAHVKRNWEA